jgi:hypothetical protein
LKCFALAFVFAFPAFGIEVQIDGPARVAQFNKIEFAILSVPETANPYNPAEAKLDLEINSFRRVNHPSRLLVSTLRFPSRREKRQTNRMDVSR